MQKWQQAGWMAACAALIAAPALAQGGETIARDGVMTLADAVATAQRQNRSVLAAQERVRGAEARIREARAGFLPQVNIGVAANQTEPLGTSTPAPAIPGLSGLGGGNTRVGSYSARATVSETVFAGTRIVNGVKVAELGLAAAREDERNTRQEVSLNVTLAYYNVLRAQGGVGIAREALRSAEAHLSDAQKTLKAGVATRLDVLRAETQVLDLRQQLSRAELALTTARNQLNVILYRDLSTPVTLDPNPPVPPVAVPLEEARARALAGRPELRRLEASRQINETTAIIQDRATWPTITISASVEHADANVSSQQRSAFGYGANLSWNIFDGLAAASRADQSLALARQDVLNLEQLRRSVAAEVEQSLQELQEAQARVGVARKNVEVATESLRLANRRYQAGVGTNTEVLDATVAMVQAQNNHNNARFDAGVAQARLDRAVGGEAGGL